MIRTSTIMDGDALQQLRTLPDGSCDCCVTSPPYWKMRDYGHEDQLGTEDKLEDFITRCADIFDEVFRVLANDGTCWINMGDSYQTKGGHRTGSRMRIRYADVPGRKVDEIGRASCRERV